MHQKLHAHIIEKSEVAENTTEVTFEVNEGTFFNFTPGQYARVSILDTEGSKQLELTRDLSICSAPDQRKLSVVFRNSGSSFKQQLLFGSDIDILIEGPFGTFTLPDDTTAPVVLVAGGIGIAPYISILRALQARQSTQEIHLIYANSSLERTAYNDELKTLASAGNITITHIVGHISDKDLSEHIKKSKAKWYMCGPPAMVSAVRGSLLRLGVAESNIHFEEFSGY